MIDYNQLKQLIKQLIFSETVATQSDFASKLGYERSTISGMTSGKKPITESFANKVSATFDVNFEWLMTGEGEMFNENNKLSENLSTTEIVSGKMIPLFDVEAVTGTDSVDMTPSSHPMSMIEIGSILKDSELAIRVYGNSMVPNYPAGCIVGLRIYQESFVVPGHVYVLETEENRYLKRVYVNKEKTALRCVSDNTMVHNDGPMKGEYTYPDFEIPFDSIRRLFRVVGVIKRNMM